MIVVIIAVVVVLIGFVAFTGAPYVPSLKRDVVKVFDKLYRLKPDDVLVDIGSGDGIVLREASRRGARAIGYEIHPLLVLLSRFLSRGDERVSVRLVNFWKTHLPDETTVVYVFGDGRDIEKIGKYVQTEANRIGRDLWMISYGLKTSVQKPEKSIGAHHLYRIKSLHTK